MTCTRNEGEFSKSLEKSVGFYKKFDIDAVSVFTTELTRHDDEIKNIYYGISNWHR